MKFTIFFLFSYSAGLVTMDLMARYTPYMDPEVIRTELQVSTTMQCEPCSGVDDSEKLLILDKNLTLNRAPLECQATWVYPNSAAKYDEGCQLTYQQVYGNSRLITTEAVLYGPGQCTNTNSKWRASPKPTNKKWSWGCDGTRTTNKTGGMLIDKQLGGIKRYANCHIETAQLNQQRTTISNALFNSSVLLMHVHNSIWTKNETNDELLARIVEVSWVRQVGGQCYCEGVKRFSQEIEGYIDVEFSTPKREKRSWLQLLAAGVDKECFRVSRERETRSIRSAEELEYYYAEEIDRNVEGYTYRTELSEDFEPVYSRADETSSCCSGLVMLLLMVIATIQLVTVDSIGDWCVTAKADCKRRSILHHMTTSGVVLRSDFIERMQTDISQSIKLDIMSRVPQSNLFVTKSNSDHVLGVGDSGYTAIVDQLTVDGEPLPLPCGENQVVAVFYGTVGDLEIFELVNLDPTTCTYLSRVPKSSYASDTSLKTGSIVDVVTLCCKRGRDNKNEVPLKRTGSTFDSVAWMDALVEDSRYVDLGLDISDVLELINTVHANAGPHSNPPRRRRRCKVYYRRVIKTSRYLRRCNYGLGKRSHVTRKKTTTRSVHKNEYYEGTRGYPVVRYGTVDAANTRDLNSDVIAAHNEARKYIKKTGGSSGLSKTVCKEASRKPAVKSLTDKLLTKGVGLPEVRPRLDATTIEIPEDPSPIFTSRTRATPVNHTRFNLLRKNARSKRYSVPAHSLDNSVTLETDSIKSVAPAPLSVEKMVAIGELGDDILVCKPINGMYLGVGHSGLTVVPKLLELSGSSSDTIINEENKALVFLGTTEEGWLFKNLTWDLTVDCLLNGVRTGLISENSYVYSNSDRIHHVTLCSVRPKTSGHQEESLYYDECSWDPVVPIVSVPQPASEASNDVCRHLDDSELESMRTLLSQVPWWEDSEALNLPLGIDKFCYDALIDLHKAVDLSTPEARLKLFNMTVDRRLPEDLYRLVKRILELVSGVCNTETTDRIEGDVELPFPSPFGREGLLKRIKLETEVSVPKPARSPRRGFSKNSRTEEYMSGLEHTSGRRTVTLEKDEVTKYSVKALRTRYIIVEGITTNGDILVNRFANLTIRKGDSGLTFITGKLLMASDNYRVLKLAAMTRFVFVARDDDYLLLRPAGEPLSRGIRKMFGAKWLIKGNTLTETDFKVERKFVLCGICDETFEDYCSHITGNFNSLRNDTLYTESMDTLAGDPRYPVGVYCSQDAIRRTVLKLRYETERVPGEDLPTKYFLGSKGKKYYGVPSHAVTPGCKLEDDTVVTRSADSMKVKYLEVVGVTEKGMIIVEKIPGLFLNKGDSGFTVSTQYLIKSAESTKVLRLHGCTDMMFVAKDKRYWVFLPVDTNMRINIVKGFGWQWTQQRNSMTCTGSMVSRVFELCSANLFSWNYDHSNARQLLEEIGLLNPGFVNVPIYENYRPNPIPFLDNVVNHTVERGTNSNNEEDDDEHYYECIDPVGARGTPLPAVPISPSSSMESISSIYHDAIENHYNINTTEDYRTDVSEILFGNTVPASNTLKCPAGLSEEWMKKLNDAFPTIDFVPDRGYNTNPHHLSAFLRSIQYTVVENDLFKKKLFTVKDIGSSDHFLVKLLMDGFSVSSCSPSLTVRDDLRSLSESKVESKDRDLDDDAPYPFEDIEDAQFNLRKEDVERLKCYNKCEHCTDSAQALIFSFVCPDVKTEDVITAMVQSRADVAYVSLEDNPAINLGATSSRNPFTNTVVFTDAARSNRGDYHTEGIAVTARDNDKRRLSCGKRLHNWWFTRGLTRSDISLRTAQQMDEYMNTLNLEGRNGDKKSVWDFADRRPKYYEDFDRLESRINDESTVTFRMSGNHEYVHNLKDFLSITRLPSEFNIKVDGVQYTVNTETIMAFANFKTIKLTIKESTKPAKKVLVPFEGYGYAYVIFYSHNKRLVADCIRRTVLQVPSETAKRVYESIDSIAGLNRSKAVRMISAVSTKVRVTNNFVITPEKIDAETRSKLTEAMLVLKHQLTVEDALHRSIFSTDKRRLAQKVWIEIVWPEQSKSLRPYPPKETCTYYDSPTLTTDNVLVRAQASASTQLHGGCPVTVRVLDSKSVEIQMYIGRRNSTILRRGATGNTIAVDVYDHFNANPDDDVVLIYWPSNTIPKLISPTPDKTVILVKVTNKVNSYSIECHEWGRQELVLSSNELFIKNGRKLVHVVDLAFGGDFVHPITNDEVNGDNTFSELKFAVDVPIVFEMMTNETFPIRLLRLVPDKLRRLLADYKRTEVLMSDDVPTRRTNLSKIQRSSFVSQVRRYSDDDLDTPVYNQRLSRNSNTNNNNSTGSATRPIDEQPEDAGDATDLHKEGHRDTNGPLSYCGDNDRSNYSTVAHSEDDTISLETDSVKTKASKPLPIDKLEVVGSLNNGILVCKPVPGLNLGVGNSGLTVAPKRLVSNNQSEDGVSNDDGKSLVFLGTSEEGWLFKNDEWDINSENRLGGVATGTVEGNRYLYHNGRGHFQAVLCSTEYHRSRTQAQSTDPAEELCANDNKEFDHSDTTTKLDICNSEGAGFCTSKTALNRNNNANDEGDDGNSRRRVAFEMVDLSENGRTLVISAVELLEYFKRTNHSSRKLDRLLTKVKSNLVKSFKGKLSRNYDVLDCDSTMIFIIYDPAKLSSSDISEFSSLNRCVVTNSCMTLSDTLRTTMIDYQESTGVDTVRRNLYLELIPKNFEGELEIELKRTDADIYAGGSGIRVLDYNNDLRNISSASLSDICRSIVGDDDNVDDHALPRSLLYVTNREEFERIKSRVTSSNLIDRRKIKCNQNYLSYSDSQISTEVISQDSNYAQLSTSKSRGMKLVIVKVDDAVTIDPRIYGWLVRLHNKIGIKVKIVGRHAIRFADCLRCRTDVSSEDMLFNGDSAVDTSRLEFWFRSTIQCCSESELTSFKKSFGEHKALRNSILNLDGSRDEEGRATDDSTERVNETGNARRESRGRSRFRRLVSSIRSRRLTTQVTPSEERTPDDQGAPLPVREHVSVRSRLRNLGRNMRRRVTSSVNRRRSRRNTSSSRTSSERTDPEEDNLSFHSSSSRSDLSTGSGEVQGRETSANLSVGTGNINPSVDGTPPFTQRSSSSGVDSARGDNICLVETLERMSETSMKFASHVVRNLILRTINEKGYIDNYKLREVKWLSLNFDKLFNIGLGQIINHIDSTCGPSLRRTCLDALLRIAVEPQSLNRSIVVSSKPGLFSFRRAAISREVVEDLIVCKASSLFDLDLTKDLSDSVGKVYDALTLEGLDSATVERITDLIKTYGTLLHEGSRRSNRDQEGGLSNFVKHLLRRWDLFVLTVVRTILLMTTIFTIPANISNRVILGVRSVRRVTWTRITVAIVAFFIATAFPSTLWFFTTLGLELPFMIAKGLTWLYETVVKTVASPSDPGIVADGNLETVIRDYWDQRMVTSINENLPSWLLNRTGPMLSSNRSVISEVYGNDLFDSLSVSYRFKGVSNVVFVVSLLVSIIADALINRGFVTKPLLTTAISAWVSIFYSTFVPSTGMIIGMIALSVTVIAVALSICLRVINELIDQANQDKASGSVTLFKDINLKFIVLLHGTFKFVVIKMIEVTSCSVKHHLPRLMALICFGLYYYLDQSNLNALAFLIGCLFLRKQNGVLILTNITISFLNFTTSTFVNKYGFVLWTTSLLLTVESEEGRVRPETEGLLSDLIPGTMIRYLPFRLMVKFDKLLTGVNLYTERSISPTTEGDATVLKKLGLTIKQSVSPATKPLTFGLMKLLDSRCLVFEAEYDGDENLGPLPPRILKPTGSELKGEDLNYYHLHLVKDKHGYLYPLSKRSDLTTSKDCKRYTLVVATLGENIFLCGSFGCKYIKPNQASSKAIPEVLEALKEPTYNRSRLWLSSNTRQLNQMDVMANFDVGEKLLIVDFTIIDGKLFVIHDKRPMHYGVSADKELYPLMVSSPSNANTNNSNTSRRRGQIGGRNIPDKSVAHLKWTGTYENLAQEFKRLLSVVGLDGAVTECKLMPAGCPVIGDAYFQSRNFYYILCDGDYRCDTDLRAFVEAFNKEYKFCSAIRRLKIRHLATAVPVIVVPKKRLRKELLLPITELATSTAMGLFSTIGHCEWAKREGMSTGRPMLHQRTDTTLRLKRCSSLMKEGFEGISVYCTNHDVLVSYSELAEHLDCKVFDSPELRNNHNYLQFRDIVESKFDLYNTDAVHASVVGPPGTGKTHLLKSVVRVGDLVVVPTKVACRALDDVVKGLRVSTNFSVLHKFSGSKYNVLHVDELYLNHWGLVILIAMRFKCKLILSYGDRNQIKVFPNGFKSFLYSDPSWTDEYLALSVSRRLTPKVTEFFAKYYERDLVLKTMNRGKNVKDHVVIMEDSNLPRTAKRGDTVIVLTQSEKASAQNLLKDRGVEILTAHEAQGITRKRVIFYYPKDLTTHLSTTEPLSGHLLVALTRSSESLIYVGVESKIRKLFATINGLDGKGTLVSEAEFEERHKDVEGNLVSICRNARSYKGANAKQILRLRGGAADLWKTGNKNNDRLLQNLESGANTCWIKTAILAMNHAFGSVDHALLNALLMPRVGKQDDAVEAFTSIARKLFILDFAGDPVGNIAFFPGHYEYAVGMVPPVGTTKATLIRTATPMTPMINLIDEIRTKYHNKIVRKSKGTVYHKLNELVGHHDDVTNIYDLCPAPGVFATRFKNENRGSRNLVTVHHPGFVSNLEGDFEPDMVCDGDLTTCDCIEKYGMKAGLLLLDFATEGSKQSTNQFDFDENSFMILVQRLAKIEASSIFYLKTFLSEKLAIEARKYNWNIIRSENSSVFGTEVFLTNNRAIEGIDVGHLTTMIVCQWFNKIVNPTGRSEPRDGVRSAMDNKVDELSKSGKLYTINNVLVGSGFKLIALMLLSYLDAKPETIAAVVDLSEDYAATFVTGLTVFDPEVMGEYIDEIHAVVFSAGKTDGKFIDLQFERRNRMNSKAQRPTKYLQEGVIRKLPKVARCLKDAHVLVPSTSEVMTAGLTCVKKTLPVYAKICQGGRTIDFLSSTDRTKAVYALLGCVPRNCLTIDNNNKSGIVKRVSDLSPTNWVKVSTSVDKGGHSWKVGATCLTYNNLMPLDLAKVNGYKPFDVVVRELATGNFEDKGTYRGHGEFGAERVELEGDVTNRKWRSDTEVHRATTESNDLERGRYEYREPSSTRSAVGTTESNTDGDDSSRKHSSTGFVVGKPGWSTRSDNPSKKSSDGEDTAKPVEPTDAGVPEPRKRKRTYCDVPVGDAGIYWSWSLGDNLQSLNMLRDEDVKQYRRYEMFSTLRLKESTKLRREYFTFTEESWEYDTYRIREDDRRSRQLTARFRNTEKKPTMMDELQLMLNTRRSLWRNKDNGGALFTSDRSKNARIYHPSKFSTSESRAVGHSAVVFIEKEDLYLEKLRLLNTLFEFGVKTDNSDMFDEVKIFEGIPDPEYEDDSYCSVAEAVVSINQLMYKLSPTKQLFDNSLSDVEHLGRDIDWMIPNSSLVLADVDRPTPIREFKSPMIKSARCPSLPNDVKTYADAIYKRNVNVPMLRDLSDPVVTASQMIYRFLENYCVPGYQDLLDEFEENPIIPNEEDVLNWIARLDDAKVMSVLKDADEVENSCYSALRMESYYLSLKRKLKDQVNLDAEFKDQKVQTIWAHPQIVTALFSPMFSAICRRMNRILKRHLFMPLSSSTSSFIDGVNEAIQDELSETKCADFLDNMIEYDASSFDKSQGPIAHWIKILMFKLLGLNDDALSVWELSHRFGTARSRSLGIKFDVDYQQKTGDASTLIANTIVTAVGNGAIYNTRPVFACFVGDDALVAVREINDDNIEDQFARKMNLEVKTITKKSNYFCGQFLVHDELSNCYRWVYDPLKLSMKLGVMIPKDDDNMHERYVSFNDMLKPLTNLSVRADLIRQLQDRYYLSVEESTTLIRSLCSIRTFADFKFLFE